MKSKSFGIYLDVTDKKPGFPKHKKGLTAYNRKAFIYKSGSDLLSRGVSAQVSSALESLTSVFGMGTGVSSPSLPPEILFWLLGRSQSLSLRSHPQNRIMSFSFSGKTFSLNQFLFGQALDLLVSVSLIHYCTYTSDLSTM
jgi:hypothetical protein